MIFKFIKLDTKLKLLILEAYIFLLFSRMMIILIPFKYLSLLLGKQNQESSFADSVKYRQKITLIKQAISVASKYTFWQSRCFTQAVCAHWMLKLRDIPYTLYMGVKLDENKNMKAHAWLRVGSKIITGVRGHRKYAPTGVFSYLT